MSTLDLPQATTFCAVLELKRHYVHRANNSTIETFPITMIFFFVITVAMTTMNMFDICLYRVT